MANTRDQSIDEDTTTRWFLRPGGAMAAVTLEEAMPKLHTHAEMLTVKEAADLLRVNVKTIHKLLASGDLPHFRLDRVIRIDRRVLLSTGKAA